ncbi:reverse transcriptase domain protein [Colletotrichum chrysophilum]|uniref:Reverse transcriptase domain protein n=1 Tax=Colletotrichum chrysophilum TaxID=1836956 RepID=A0AAD9EBP6_9PEZI|nr:reverse transcriptase domain protein [Colletotrichum chrysophilum]
MRLEACATTLSTTRVGHLNRGQSHHGPFSALHDVNQIQEAMNSNAVAKFQNFVQQSPESQRIQALQQEVNTLRSAASITTAVLDERDKHRLNSPQAFDGTGHL